MPISGTGFFYYMLMLHIGIGSNGCSEHAIRKIGHIIAIDSTIAMQLLSAALRHGEGKPTVIDVLDHTSEWMEFVSSLGFVALRPLIRMYRGSNSYPGLPEKQFAILGPEFG